MPLADHQAMLENNEDPTPKGEQQQVLAANIDRAIRESTITPAQIADACGGISVQSVSNWRRTGKITKENLRILANLVDWTMEELQRPGGKTEKSADNAIENVDGLVDLLPVQLAPVTGTASLGPDGTWYELEYPTGHGDGYIPVHSRDRNVYALRVRGDSMHPRIRDGEYVIISPNTSYIPSNDVMVQTNDGRSMVKELAWQREGQIKLLSINERHPPIVLDLSEVRVIHRVIGTAQREALVRHPGKLNWE